MKLYLYDKITKEYVRSITPLINLQSSREQGSIVYEERENSTTIEPPLVGKNEIQVFEDGNWVIKKDYRDHKFFDVKTNRKVIVTEIGEIPDNYVSLTSQEYTNYLNKNDETHIKNNIRNKIEELYTIKLQEDILIGKHYFSLLQLPTYEQMNNDIITKINEYKTKIDKIQLQLARLNKQTEESIIQYNTLAEEQCSLYKAINSITLSLSVKNKRRKTIKLECTYDEFTVIKNELQQVKKQIDKKRDQALLKLRLCNKEKALIFETALVDKGLDYVKTRNEANIKINF